MAGMATAARVQARGLSTVVHEAHRSPGGCAGYFRRQGFAFDVGASTLVDFDEACVGGELLREIGIASVEVSQYRAVMLSTHCSVEERKGLDRETSGSRKAEIAERLLGLARRVYRTLERTALFEVATPQTYECYTRRPRGAVAGFRLHLGNCNQRAIP